MASDRLQVGEVVSTIPTIGFNVETVNYKNIKFQVRIQSHPSSHSATVATVPALPGKGCRREGASGGPQRDMDTAHSRCCVCSRPVRGALTTHALSTALSSSGAH